MTDNEKRAHDIAVALLPNALNELGCSIYVFDDKNIGHINKSDIAETYKDLFEELLDEFNN